MYCGYVNNVMGGNMWQGYFITKTGTVETLPSGSEHNAIRPRWYRSGYIRVRLYGGSKFLADGKLAIEAKELNSRQREILPVLIGSWLAQNWIHEVVYCVDKTAPLIVCSPVSRIRKFCLTCN
mgnify:CR=1 FL=1